MPFSCCHTAQLYICCMFSRLLAHCVVLVEHAIRVWQSIAVQTLNSIAHLSLLLVQTHTQTHTYPYIQNDVEELRQFSYSTHVNTHVLPAPYTYTYMRRYAASCSFECREPTSKSERRKEEKEEKIMLLAEMSKFRLGVGQKNVYTQIQIILRAQEACDYFLIFLTSHIAFILVN